MMDDETADCSSHGIRFLELLPMMATNCVGSSGEKVGRKGGRHRSICSLVRAVLIHQSL